uniref:Uncharacterized protein n=1 Tax=Anguilla anguilla TaxID=7936 RepID=A0A0E9T071_ANGAN
MNKNGTPLCVNDSSWCCRGTLGLELDGFVSLGGGVILQGACDMFLFVNLKFLCSFQKMKMTHNIHII